MLSSQQLHHVPKHSHYPKKKAYARKAVTPDSKTVCKRMSYFIPKKMSPTPPHPHPRLGPVSSHKKNPEFPWQGFVFYWSLHPQGLAQILVHRRRLVEVYGTKMAEMGCQACAWAIRYACFSSSVLSQAPRLHFTVDSTWSSPKSVLPKKPVRARTGEFSFLLRVLTPCASQWLVP